jgi:poly(3-hydroxybutyrate) depolymerase
MIPPPCHPTPRPSPLRHPSRRTICLVALLAGLSSPASGATQQTTSPAAPIALRYDLRPGDHLVYRETLRRETHGRVEAASAAEWTTHVLVFASAGGEATIGVQRNRTRADLLGYRVDGVDQTEHRRAEFLAQHADTRFAAANRVDEHGRPLLPFVALREWTSRVLWNVGEIQPVPAQAVSVGDRWTEPGALAITSRAEAWEQLGGESCLRVEGLSTTDALGPPEATADTFRLRYWFCPASGLTRRLELDATYSGLARQHEMVTFELVGRTRGESVDAWLGEPDLRRAVLAAGLADASLALSPAQVDALLADADSLVRRDVLALVHRRRLPAPSLARLTAVFTRDAARNRALAIRALERTSADSALPLIRLALADTSRFVRDAALAWVRIRLPEERAAVLRSSADALAALPSVTSATPDSTSVGPADPTSADCRTDAIGTWTLIHSRRLPEQAVGTTVRSMTSRGYEGWPYVVRVPEEYRPDEPVPLLIYLSGGQGLALDPAQASAGAMDATGYLVVYPHAGRWWWRRDATDMVDALIDEVERTYNVDPDRVYLTGFSNGGTGAFWYANLWPHRFSAVATLMGAGMFLPPASPEDVPAAANLSNLPVLLLHGDADSTVNPQATERTAELLRPGRHAALEKHLFHGVGHEILVGRADGGLTLGFFARQDRHPFPQEVSFETRSLASPRRYWVEIVRKADAAPNVAVHAAGGDAGALAGAFLSSLSPASVTGRIESGNTIRLQTRNVSRLRLLLRPELLDGSGPVRVFVNGRKVYDAPLPHNCALYRQSLAEHPDPYLAYTAAITIDVPM